MGARKNIHLDQLIASVTRDVTEHPRDLAKVYADRFEVSRVTANRLIQRLETAGWIARSGPATHPVYAPGYRRRITVRRNLEGLAEDLLWEAEIAPFLAVTANVRRIAQHGITEMVNNAIDHSGGKWVLVTAWQEAKHVGFVVIDDGVGIFKKITDAMRLADMRLALFELAKGKFTTDPARHSGEGVFFTSRMFDTFKIEANDLTYEHDESVEDDWLVPANDDALTFGTVIVMSISLDAVRTTTEVFQKYMNAPDDVTFSKTVVPMRLAQFGDEQLVSRSQAKRLIARFDRFRTVVLDFAGVSEIGQGFSDELFRVYARAHLDVELMPINMTEQVERMWLRATTSGIGS